MKNPDFVLRKHHNFDIQIGHTDDEARISDSESSREDHFLNRHLSNNFVFIVFKNICLYEYFCHLGVDKLENTKFHNKR